MQSTPITRDEAISLEEELDELETLYGDFTLALRDEVTE